MKNYKKKTLSNSSLRAIVEPPKFGQITAARSYFSGTLEHMDLQMAMFRKIFLVPLRFFELEYVL